MISMMRRKAAWTQIGVGRSKFDEDFVYHNGGDEYIPGTKVRRLKLVKLGHRTVAAVSDEVEALIEALRAERDAKHEAELTATQRRRSLSETARENLK